MAKSAVTTQRVLTCTSAAGDIIERALVFLPGIERVDFGERTAAALNGTVAVLTPGEAGDVVTASPSTEPTVILLWTDSLANLPEIAYAHHEKLDGTGYPRELEGSAIPVQMRLLTICDIFDALTAGDRPYKQALTVETALDILATEARAARIDAELLRVFVESGAYRLRS